MPLILQRHIDEEVGTVFHLEGFRYPIPYKSHEHDVLILGRSAEVRTWWQFCIVSHDPKELIQHLRTNKFDATDGSSRLAPVSASEGYPVASRTEYAMRNVVYVPAYAHMGSSSRKRLAAVINMRPELLATFSSMQNYLSGA